MKKDENLSQQVFQIITAKWISGPLYVAARLGIADMLEDGPLHIDDLSGACRAHSPTLYRVLKALSAVGFFSEVKEKTFELTPMAEYLQKDKMRPFALMFLSEWHNRAWDRLLHTTKTGEPAFNTAFGMSCFEWLQQHPEEARWYNEANSLKAGTIHTAIIDSYDFSAFNSVVDIGGGAGSLLCKILENHEDIRGTIADLANLKTEAETNIIERKLTGRCQFSVTDFFNAVPSGYNCYLLSNILHDWNDEECADILKNCHAAMSSKSRLLVVETLIPEGDEFSIARLLDLEVLVMGGGRERSADEYKKCFKTAGFHLEKIINTGENVSVLECVKK